MERPKLVDLRSVSQFNGLRTAFRAGFLTIGEMYVQYLERKEREIKISEMVKSQRGKENNKLH